MSLNRYAIYATMRTAELGVQRYNIQLCVIENNIRHNVDIPTGEKKHLGALEQLWTRQDILLTKPDKGCGIVIMNRRKYIDKIEDLLSDNSKFLQSDKDKDRTKVNDGQLTECLERLKNQDSISEQTFERIRPFGTVVPA